ncbi:(2Fe-2S)-binding protein [Croceicoccus bisphenolivorans]|uniref:(2Fe-2S)-binding protein n=1 Tax=Croceicoccus bisphenolivorans TaxID=1783232 RepID=UPI00083679A2|nr:(2Fe-2S)-binding protein [Croceicoccus bisphenolivorans]
MTARFQRLAETDRAEVRFTVDGTPLSALAGDSLLTAMLTNGLSVRASEFGDGNRAGFCLMAACQDCWVWTEAGTRLRACSTLAEDGLAISTQQPGAAWLKNA